MSERVPAIILAGGRADANGYAAVDFPVTVAGRRNVDPFFNVNTTDDLAVAEAICEEWRQ